MSDCYFCLYLGARHTSTAFFMEMEKYQCMVGTVMKKSFHISIEF